MPYIKQEERVRLAEETKFDLLKINSPGELNFLFTVLAKVYLKQHGLNYQHINDVMGALEGAKLEFYARLARPYEQQKIAENGDVYGSSLKQLNTK